MANISAGIFRVLISDPTILVVTHRSILKKGEYADKFNNYIEKIGPVFAIKERMSNFYIWISSCSTSDKNQKYKEMNTWELPLFFIMHSLLKTSLNISPYQY